VHRGREGGGEVKISEFVAALEAIQEKHGDIPVASGSIMGGHYEPTPDVEEVKLDVRVGKRIVEMLTLCVVVG
jgi:hypothetical protein